MQRLFLLILTLFSFNFVSSQDYKTIDKYLMNNTLKETSANGVFESLNILLSSNDCDNSIPYLYGYLKNVDKNRSFVVNIVTDNVVYAKKALGISDELNCKFYYNNEIFSKYLKGRSGVYYKDGNDKIYSEDKIIGNKIKNSNERTEFYNSILKNEYVLAEDSLLSTMPFISATMLPDNRLLIFDSKMDLAFCATINHNQNTISVLNSAYVVPKTSDLKKIYGLLKVDEQFLSYEENLDHLEKYHLKMLKIYSIVFSENQYFITFGVTTAKKEEEGQIRFSDTYFVATQNTNNLSIENSLDVSTYENYYLIDNFLYDGENYKIIGNIRNKPHVVNKSQLNWRIRKPNDQTRSVDYAGLATIELKDGITSILHIDDKFDEFLDMNPIFEFNDRTYYLFKKNISKEKNKSTLIFKEFNSNFINSYRKHIEKL